MAESYGFFDSSENDTREYSANVLAEFFRKFYSSGFNDGLKIIPGTGLSLVEQSGYAILQGFFYKNDGDLTVQLDKADPNLPRIDRIVLHLDLTLRTIKLMVKKGDTSSSPAVAALQRDNSAYELGLAQIKVNAGMTDITATSIIDERYDSDACGLVSALVHPMTAVKDSQPGNLMQGDIWIQTL